MRPLSWRARLASTCGAGLQPCIASARRAGFRACVAIACGAGLRACLAIACGAGLQPSIASAQELPPGAPSWEAGGTATLSLEAARRAEIDKAIKAEQWEKAEQLLAAEIERTPQPVELLKLIANVFMRDRKPLNAAIALKKAEAIGPLDAPSRYQLALAYIGIRRGEWARPVLDGLLWAEPNNPSYLYWLARIDYDAGKYAAAVARLQRVVSLQPGFTRAYDNLGLCYEALNRPEEAIAQYSEAIRRARLLGEPWPWPFLNLGILHRKAGELEQAEKLLREALAIDPTFAPALYQLGAVLEYQEKVDEAVTALRQAAAADPAYAEPHFALARIYRRQGKTKEADAALATFERLHAPTREPRK
jgi:tetratricopeptide (TPR) repeat protein